MQRLTKAGNHAEKAVTAGRNIAKAKVAIEPSFGTFEGSIKMGGVVKAVGGGGCVKGSGGASLNGVTVDVKGGILEGKMMVGSGNNAASSSLEVGVGKGAVNMDYSKNVTANEDLVYLDAAVQVGGDKNINLNESGELGFGAKFSMLKVSVSANILELGTAITEGILSLSALGVFDEMKPDFPKKRE